MEGIISKSREDKTFENVFKETVFNVFFFKISLRFMHILQIMKSNFSYLDRQDITKESKNAKNGS